jgi:hypothetical protein
MLILAVVRHLPWSVPDRTSPIGISEMRNRGCCSVMHRVEAAFPNNSPQNRSGSPVFQLLRQETSPLPKPYDHKDLLGIEVKSGLAKISVFDTHQDAFERGKTVFQILPTLPSLNSILDACPHSCRKSKTQGPPVSLPDPGKMSLNLALWRLEIVGSGDDSGVPAWKRHAKESDINSCAFPAPSNIANAAARCRFSADATFIRNCL